ncbi:MAG: DEAD/DEAH box helicase [Ruminococcaceae bacterium]|nr:DEAD/DEAH box helicase [Oscillospiraceae bacterium]
MNEAITFSQLKLIPEIQASIEEMGFDYATPIQSKAIPFIRSGADVIGRSQTGTGKTLAFAIPAIEMLDFSKQEIQVLVLCPTRELARQAYQETKNLSKYLKKVNCVAIYGGDSMEKQFIKLKRANMIIGTPGRIMDHMRRDTIKLDAVKAVILDEADEMLSMGFKEDIETILSKTPQQKQTIMFSATMPPEILKLTNEFQQNPKIIEIDKAKVTLENINQNYIETPIGKKREVLNLFLNYYNPQRAIIFCNTKQMSEETFEFLRQNKFRAECIHGDLKQAQRLRALDAFKSGVVKILVATDVAARGIDVNDIDYVINYDIPQNTEYYVHRIGRTARAGKSGISVTLCSGKRQVYVMFDIAKAVKSEIKSLPIPTCKQINQKNMHRQIDNVIKLLENGVSAEYTQMLNHLKCDYDLSSDEIASAILQLQFQDSYPILEDVYLSKPTLKKKEHKKAADTKRKSKTVSKSYDESNYSKLLINIGKKSKAAPNHVVGAITERTNISGKDIGKIQMFDSYCIVSIKNSLANEVVKKMIGCKICGKPVKTEIHKDKKATNTAKKKKVKL